MKPRGFLNCAILLLTLIFSADEVCGLMIEYDSFQKTINIDPYDPLSTNREAIYLSFDEPGAWAGRPADNPYAFAFVYNNFQNDYFTLLGSGGWSTNGTGGLAGHRSLAPISGPFSLTTRHGGFIINTDAWDVINGVSLLTITDLDGEISTTDLEKFNYIYQGEVRRISAVPEPSTFLLLGGGLAGLAFLVRRKRKE